jgi:hypothetical protein
MFSVIGWALIVVIAVVMLAVIGAASLWVGVTNCPS